MLRPLPSPSMPVFSVEAGLFAVPVSVRLAGRLVVRSGCVTPDEIDESDVDDRDCP